jgi:hypothetical protein
MKKEIKITIGESTRHVQVYNYTGNTITDQVDLFNTLLFPFEELILSLTDIWIYEASIRVQHSSDKAGDYLYIFNNTKELRAEIAKYNFKSVHNNGHK